MCAYCNLQIGKEERYKEEKFYFGGSKNKLKKTKRKTITHKIGEVVCISGIVGLKEKNCFKFQGYFWNNIKYKLII